MIQVGKIGRAFMAALDTRGSSPAVPLTKLAHILPAASEIPAKETELEALALFGLAYEAHTQTGALAHTMIGQLYALVAALIGVERADATFDSAGLEIGAAQKALGFANSRTPVEGTPVSAGKSLMALRLGIHKDNS